MSLPARLVPPVVACLLAGCSAGPVPSPPAQPPSPPAQPAPPAARSAPPPVPSAPPPPFSAAAGAIDCAHDLGARPPSEGYPLVLDAVALPTAVLQANESGEPGRLFAKTGLLVRAGTAVELSVAPEAAGDVIIGWGSPGPKGTTVRVPACPDAKGWVVFAGGYTVSEPVCVPLIVRVGDREQRAEVSVGVSC
ncbi:hypothetical protein [Actinoplanes sp. M2I2]|uniref:hypothetical protein n=1 Tax=Actinoplanes sp. M2I2 TaxID=1734444 RepID=UPI0020229038|nr:hypothetical protein [Actinoplanes sp. M2I2]